MKQVINKISSTLLLAAVLFTGACKKDFESVNTPPKDATTATTPEIFNAIVSSLPLGSGEQSVLNAWVYPITQQAILTSGSYPYINARGEVWKNFYVTMGNYRILQSRIDTAADKSIYNNLYAMLKTIMAYKAIKVTNYYGDMPYSKAGYASFATDSSISVYKVPYDKQADIYAAALADLKWAVDNFSTASSQYSLGNYETLFKNDIAMWIKFANSLRLYAAVTMNDKNSPLASTHIAEALSKPLLADGDNVGMWPSNITNLKFDWRQWSFSANCYLRLGSTMWNLMSANNNANGSGIFDPRCKIFFETNNDSTWAAYPQNPVAGTPSEGGDPYNTKRFTDWGTKGAACIYSPFNLYFEQDITYIPELILTAAQVHFIKAEVYNRGLGTSANAAMAQTEYKAGITASVNMWNKIAYNSATWKVNKPAAETVAAADINALLANPLVAYDLGSSSNALKQIYSQLWIDQFRQPWDTWTLLRRTGGKTPMSSTNTQYYQTNFAIYNRFTYPDDEVSYNADNWKTATGGNDVSSTKIWLMP